MWRLSRRQFLRRSVVLASGALGSFWLAACSLVNRPTPTPVPPTAVPQPTFVARFAAPASIKTYPAAPSKVVHTRHAGVYAGDKVDPAIVRQMLDASIAALTGQTDMRAAWAGLFRPEERIGIKVNTFASNIWTHVALVSAVTDSLQEAGIPAEQILIFDRQTTELQRSGFKVNPEGPGVCCRGTDSDYATGWRMVNRPTQLSKLLLECDALISMPVLKQHMYGGISFCLKNHYGTINNPGSFHGSYALDALPQLNALAPIRSLHRLVVGDALWKALGDNWEKIVPGDSIYVSHDPVACDAVALREMEQTMTADGKDPAGYVAKANTWLQGAAKLGLGTHEAANMQVTELKLP
jgi:uncharacterized protein (DUF362 family)